MKVQLVEHTPNPERLIAAAAKLCYSAVGVDEITENLTEENVEKFLNILMSYGHESPIEHVSFTFAVEGVSRSLTHQLVRHRIASFSQQSQRYVRAKQFEYIVPPAIENDESLKKIYVEAMENSQKAYDKIADELKEKYIREGMNKTSAEKKAIEDARYVFPNAAETKIMFTMNARSLMNFFRHRCCDRAQWEIRNMANLMVIEVKKVAKTLFKYSGPSCLNGRCPEGKMSCGKMLEMKKIYLGEND